MKVVCPFFAGSVISKTPERKEDKALVTARIVLDCIAFLLVVKGRKLFCPCH